MPVIVPPVGVSVGTLSSVPVGNSFVVTDGLAVATYINDTYGSHKHSHNVSKGIGIAGPDGSVASHSV